jgi:hypothetical protein
MRRKYAKHLGDKAKELMRRDAEEMEESRRGLHKRANGTVS